VGTLFDQACEDFIVAEMGYEMRPWQRAVLLRAFEVDCNGRLVWRVIIVSVGRQSGKTYLIRMLTNLRQRLFAHHEPQEILHIGRVRDAARAVIVNERFARWAKGRGIVVRSSNGQEQWRWPDDSTWDLSSLDGAYGRSAGLVLLDETWDITRQQYYEGIQPTMAAREQAQVWFFSAAHREATELTPLMIERARAGRDGYALFDWGASDGDDLTDPEVWQRMGPHWDENRRAAVADAVEEDSFAEQWANVWPDVLGRAIAKSPFPNWGSLPAVPSNEPPPGALVALDEHYDASRVMVAALHEGGLWVQEVADVQAGVELAHRWSDGGEVLVGFSLRHVVAPMGLRHAIPYGMKETALGTPLLLDTVKQGQLAHEHSELMDRAMAGARVKVSDAGTMTLSIKTSASNVTGVKLAAWLLLHERNRGNESPAVW
jgi:hypothetical protein